MSTLTKTIRDDLGAINKMARKMAESKTAKPVHGLRLGAIPTPSDLVPQGFTDTALPALGLVSGALLANAAMLSPMDSFYAGTLTALALVIARRIETAQQRRGCILKEGGVFIRESWESKDRRGNVDPELTAIYKSALGDETVFAEREQSEQYDIHVIYNDDPNAIKNKLNKIALKVGQPPEELMFRPVWTKGCSAVLVHRPESEWSKGVVGFDKSAVMAGRMILQAGRSIHGETMTYNRETYPHVLIAGETGSGKTEAMVADMHATKASGLNPIINIIDPKNTPQLKRIKNTLYTNDAEEGIDLLKDIVAQCEERLNRYSAAGCDNFYQYREKHSSERPLCVYIDEVAELVTPDVSTDKKKAKQIADAAIALITRLVQKYRSAGLFVTLGMQHPLAEVLSTNIRNNLGVRIVLSVADKVAAGVAGTPGAENLPMQGGMILKVGKRLSYGRGIYIQQTA